MVVISAAVEGLVDEAVAKTLIRDAGADHGQIYGKKANHIYGRASTATTMLQGSTHGSC